MNQSNFKVEEFDPVLKFGLHQAPSANQESQPIPMSGSKSSSVDIAVLLLGSYPYMTVQEAAKLSGCNRTALYRQPKFRQIHQQRIRRRAAAMADRPKGLLTKVRGDPEQTLREAIDPRPNPLELLIEKESEEADFQY